MIYIDSISKTVGGGLRVGWIAASGPVRERILREKRADDLHSATMTQLAVASFLEAGEYPGHIERARDFYRERRDVLIEATDKHLKGMATVATESPQGGHLWLTLDLPLDESELMTEAVRNGVTFVPGRGDAARGVPPDAHAPLLRLPGARAARRGHQAPRPRDPLAGKAPSRQRGAADRLVGYFRFFFFLQPFFFFAAAELRFLPFFFFLHFFFLVAGHLSWTAPFAGQPS